MVIKVPAGVLSAVVFDRSCSLKVGGATLPKHRLIASGSCKVLGMFPRRYYPLLRLEGETRVRRRLEP